MRALPPIVRAYVKFVVRALGQDASAKQAKINAWFFKETIASRGLNVPQVREIEKKAWTKFRDRLDGKKAVVIARALFENRHWEDGFVGMALVRRYEKEFDGKTLDEFETWIEKYITNWAHCDDLCTHLIGPLLKRFPVLCDRLKDWPVSPNRWKKRASIVSFVPLAKHGLFEKEVLDISARLLANGSDDLVNKANGWTLREFGKYSSRKLFVFLKKHEKTIPRVTLRYALERAPERWKKVFTAKRMRKKGETGR